MTPRRPAYPRGPLQPDPSEIRASPLPEFLLARITEDEAAALEAATDEGGRWEIAGPFSLVASFGDLTDKMGAWSGLTEVRRPSIADHIARQSPARILVECEAKRQIVERCAFPSRHQDDGVLRLLALPYADHPDYRQEWRP